MDSYKEAWEEHWRRRFLRPDGHRWVKPDADRHYGAHIERLMHPDAYREWLRINRAERKEQPFDPEFVREVAAIRAGLVQLRAELVSLRHAQLFRKSDHYHTQPRVPAGNPDGGQWNGDGSGAVPQVFAAHIPRIPQRRPPDSRERTKVYIETAKWVGERGAAALEAIRKYAWLIPAVPIIVSYLDPPKTLEELQQDASTPKLGYDRHHIVEQTSAEEDGFSRRQIDAPENRVHVPRIKHWMINKWYQTPNERFQGMTPRDYLRKKDWDERRRVGLDALEMFGVLKP